MSSHHRHQPTRRLLAIAAITAALACPAMVAATAGEGTVVVLEGPAPDPADLARILWPDPAAAGPEGRSRSIRLTEPAAASAAAVGPGPAEPGPGAFAFLIRFRFDSTEILPESRPYLDSVGAMLGLPEARGRRVAIVGHADASGPETYNQALSERRAAAVGAYLRENFGVEPDRLATAGRGESEPLADLEPTAARNRRVEFRAAEG